MRVVRVDERRVAPLPSRVERLEEGAHLLRGAPVGSGGFLRRERGPGRAGPREDEEEPDGEGAHLYDTGRCFFTCASIIFTSSALVKGCHPWGFMGRPYSKVPS